MSYFCSSNNLTYYIIKYMQIWLLAAQSTFILSFLKQCSSVPFIVWLSFTYIKWKYQRGKEMQWEELSPWHMSCTEKKYSFHSRMKPLDILPNAVFCEEKKKSLTHVSKAAQVDIWERTEQCESSKMTLFHGSLSWQGIYPKAVSKTSLPHIEQSWLC